MTKRGWQITIAAPIVVIFGSLVSSSLLRALNPVVVGVREGSTFQADTAARIVSGLTADNYSSETLIITPSQSRGRSSESADGPVDIEITGSPLAASEHPNLLSLGMFIELPLLLVIHADSADITSPRDLKGKTIQVGLEGTTIALVAEKVLANYGVTQANSSLKWDPDDEAFASFTSRQAVAAFVYFNPELELLERLAVGAVSRSSTFPKTSHSPARSGLLFLQ